MSVSRPPFPCLAAILLFSAGAAPSQACDPSTGGVPNPRIAGRGGPAAPAPTWSPGASYSHLISIPVSNYESDCMPWLTPDESEIFFVRQDHAGPAMGIGEWDIYHAFWDPVAGKWGPATNLGPTVNGITGERSPSTTADGDTLVFARDGWVLATTRPSPAFPFAGLDTLFMGSDPCLSHDGNEIYYVHQDSIRVADRGSSGLITDWINDRALNSLINTADSEVRPYISHDGTKLFFSDFGGQKAGGWGGVDLWVSEWDTVAADWKKPVNVGPPINMDRPACSAWLSLNEKRFYASSEASEGGRGSEDLWIAYADSTPPPATVTHPAGTWVQLGELDGAWHVYDIVGETYGTLLAATSPEGAVYRSTDGGTSWSKRTLPGVRNVYCLLRASSGDVFAGTYPLTGVFRSTDDGDTWTATATIPGATTVRSLVETSWGSLLAGVSEPPEVWESTDAGTSWAPLGSTTGLTSITALHESPSGTLFAGGWGGFFDSSSDSGGSWTVHTLSFLGGSMKSIDSWLTDSSGDLWMTGWSHDSLGYAARSTDDGASWSVTTTPMVGPVTVVRVHDIVEVPSGFLIGYEPGPALVAQRTTDGGATWSTIGALSGANEILRFHRDSAGVVYAATTPNGDVFRYDPLHMTGAGDGASVEDAPRLAAVLGGTPNPFRDATVIAFQLPPVDRARLSVLDVLGRRVRTLHEGALSPGRHHIRWDGRDDAGGVVAAGVYFARLEAPGSVTFQKIVRVR